MNTFQKTAATVLVLGATALSAGEAAARCVTGVGPLFNEANIAAITERAGSQKWNAGTRDPDNNRFLGMGTNGPLPSVRIGKFDFHKAVRRCEQQHARAVNANPGQDVYTGLECGSGATVITTRRPQGLVCR